MTELERIQSFDRVWRLLLADGEPFTTELDRKCDACGEMKRSVLVSKSGHCVCGDCHDLPTFEGYIWTPAKVPQGQELERLPYHPKFTKRFT